MSSNDDRNTGSNDRRVQNLLGLVKFCLNATASEDAPASSQLEPMDEDRRAWLQQAINNLTTDTIAELLKSLAVVKENIQLLNKPDSAIKEEETIDALEYMVELCEEVDYARDFAKLNGFDIFKPLIDCNYEELQAKACDLIAAISQNNPYCQEIAHKSGILGQLTQLLDSSTAHIKARVKALYAISTIIRSNEDILMKFDTELDGLSVLSRIIQFQDMDYTAEDTSESATEESCDDTCQGHWWRKLRIKSSFLIAALCQESDHIRTTFFRMGIIEQIILLLQNLANHETHEYLLSALCSMASTNEDCRNECLRPEFKFVQYLEKCMASTPESPEDQDDHYARLMLDQRAQIAQLMRVLSISSTSPSE